MSLIFGNSLTDLQDEKMEERKWRRESYVMCLKPSLITTVAGRYS